MGGQMDFDLVAASLRADAGDLDGFFPALAARLEGALPPGRARIDRRSKGFLSREKVVRGIEITMGDNTYSCTRGGPIGVQASRRKVVRGIALSTEELGLDAWIDALAAELAAEAEASAAARERLERMLT
jgi:hypothetical protein